MLIQKKGSPTYDYYRTIGDTTKQMIRHVNEQQAQSGQVPPPGKEPWRQAALGAGRAVLGAQAVVGAGGIANPQGVTNAAGQLINRSQVSGGISAVPGATPDLNPSAPVVAGTQATTVGSAQNDSQRYEQISSSVAPSRQAITLADQISNLSEQVRTGKFSKAVTDFAATIGQDNPTIAARQMMSKYAAQLRTVATSNAPTDSARSTIEAGFPDPEHMSPEAIRGAAEYIKGSMLMNLSRAANSRKFQEKHGSTQGLRYADDQLTTNADPLMYAYQSLSPGAERQAFIKRHFSNAKEATEFVHRKNAVEHNGGFDQ